MSAPKEPLTQITVYMPHTLVAEIEQARGDTSRSAWIVQAIRERLQCTGVARWQQQREEQ